MRFFFYGTLLDGSENQVARAIHALLHPLGPATARGVLYAIPDPQGWYPGLVEGAGPIRGELYEAREGFEPADLARLDAYEDCIPGDPAGSLYLRRKIVTVTCDGVEQVAEAYLFNQPLPDGAKEITLGDFRAWLATERLAPFSGLRDA